MSNDGDPPNLTDEQHDWIHAFTGIATRVKQAVTDGAHAVEQAVTPPSVAQTIDQGGEGAIDKSTALQEKSIDGLAAPSPLKSVAKGAVELEGGLDKGLLKVGAGLLQGAQDAADMIDGAALVRGGAKVAAAITNADDRAKLLAEMEASGKSLENRAEQVINPAGALIQAGAGVVDGYEKASAAGKTLDYVGTVAGQALGTAGVAALGEGVPEAAGETPPMEPAPDTVPRTQPGLGVDPAPPQTLPGVGPPGPELPPEEPGSPDTDIDPPRKTQPGLGPPGPALPPEEGPPASDGDAETLRRPQPGLAPEEGPISEPPPGQRVPNLPQPGEPAPASAVPEPAVQPAPDSGMISSTPPSFGTNVPDGVEPSFPPPGSPYNPGRIPPPPLPGVIPGYGTPGPDGWEPPSGTELEDPITKRSPTGDDG